MPSKTEKSGLSYCTTLDCQVIGRITFVNQFPASTKQIRVKVNWPLSKTRQSSEAIFGKRGKLIITGELHRKCSGTARQTECENGLFSSV